MKNQKTLAMATIIIGTIIGTILFASVISYFAGVHSVNFYGTIGIDMETTSIHCQINMYQNGEKVFSQYHAGAVTDFGDNATLAKLFGDSDYNLTLYDLNATFISIGNQGSLTTSSTVLPGEWNRTAGTIEDEAQSQLNITCTFYPDSGPYTADCIGLNFEGTVGINDLWAYDTFTEVSGIDDTYTITVEFQISASHS